MKPAAYIFDDIAVTDGIAAGIIYVQHYAGNELSSGTHSIVTFMVQLFEAKSIAIITFYGCGLLTKSICNVANQFQPPENLRLYFSYPFSPSCRLLAGSFCVTGLANHSAHHHYGRTIIQCV